MVQFALSTMKAFATPNDIIEISTFNKESDSLHGLVTLKWYKFSVFYLYIIFDFFERLFLKLRFRKF
jgi:hypothetical protein